MDNLRGLAIILIILLHAQINVYSGSERFSGQAPSWLLWVNQSFDPLRMPMMVFLSGMLVPRSLSKGKRAYVLGKIRGIAYPYVVWTTILVGLAWSLGRDVSITIWLRSLAIPIDHLWFLAYLFGFYLFALLTSRVNPLTVSAGAFLLLIALGPILGFRPLALLAFFMLGVAAGSPAENRFRRLISRWEVALVGFIAVVALVAIVQYLVDNEIGYSPLDSRLALLSLAVVLGTLVVAKWLDAKGVPGIFRRIGEHSIVFYLVHLPMMTIVRYALADTTLPHYMVLLFMLLLPLLVGSAIVVSMHYWPALRWLFQFSPRSPRSARSAA